MKFYNLIRVLLVFMLTFNSVQIFGMECDQDLIMHEEVSFLMELPDELLVHIMEQVNSTLSKESLEIPWKDLCYQQILTPDELKSIEELSPLEREMKKFIIQSQKAKSDLRLLSPAVIEHVRTLATLRRTCSKLNALLLPQIMATSLKRSQYDSEHLGLCIDAHVLLMSDNNFWLKALLHALDGGYNKIKSLASLEGLYHAMYYNKTKYMETLLEAGVFIDSSICRDAKRLGRTEILAVFEKFDAEQTSQSYYF